MLFFTRQPELRERPRDRGVADFHARPLSQVIAQFAERGITVGGHGRPQQLMVSRPEARHMASAVRAWREVIPGAVEAEHLIDEGHADAEQFRHLGDGAVAAQGDREHAPPQIEGVGFHGAASYFNDRVHSSARRYRLAFLLYSDAYFGLVCRA